MSPWREREAHKLHKNETIENNNCTNIFTYALGYVCTIHTCLFMCGVVLVMHIKTLSRYCFLINLGHWHLLQIIQIIIGNFFFPNKMKLNLINK